jgi:uncharacterized protein (DUF1810 family)
MDRFALERFVAAQDPVIAGARRELRAGRKRTHWMWYVFPQLRGLGRSSMAQRYAIGSLDEARAYLAHPLLGPRLIECTTIVNALEHVTAHDVFASPDDMKFHSSMTLFRAAAPDELAFADALRRYFGGRDDTGTVALL